ncbi:glycosyltransferase family 2 protein [Lipingzhangella sp. LS1_29]|uniref:Glycosyltransferase family 2 protein n=1 Tax=Lipingzhangella rawalii TaxID=2055835 RepID=A0ABU2HAK7_9ACTN|nr:glycosyltransferase family 2 protein [Lipingzhangella rawalii]MDS1272350.1 glycosyltransferase family 2 protein [Lipingzhangella rawalii]
MCPTTASPDSGTRLIPAWVRPIPRTVLTVTVHIPVYNEDPKVLRECLRSVLLQSRPVNRVRVVADGSSDAATGLPVDYGDVRAEFRVRAAECGVDATWVRTENRGERFAQMLVLADDDADIPVSPVRTPPLPGRSRGRAMEASGPAPRVPRRDAHLSQDRPVGYAGDRGGLAPGPARWMAPRYTGCRSPGVAGNPAVIDRHRGWPALGIPDVPANAPPPRDGAAGW